MTGYTVRQDVSLWRGQEALIHVLSLLCVLGDEDRLQLEGCEDPEAICRLAEYVGCGHDEAHRDASGWTVTLQLGRYRSVVD